MNPAPGSFYVTGGTLRPDAACYIEREADRELGAGLRRGEFCYVLTSRQMGKSSLMLRAVRRLRQEHAAVAVLDLTAIGQNLTLEQWYDGLLSRLGQQLNLEEELLAFGAAHPEWGPLQRWATALEQVVLARLPCKVVIFVDEIDIVRSLPFSTDEFFAAIRECYNRRSREPAFERLAFGLLGVATPNDLIRDTRMTPFNIGHRIELHDFSAREAAPLTQGLGVAEPAASELLARVLQWTGGHPYLTQRLCQALAEALRPPAADPAVGGAVPPLLPTPEVVDRLARLLFLSPQARDRDDNLVFVRERLLRSEVDVAGLLYLYRKVYHRQSVADDETNPLVSVLRLSGIVRGVNGWLAVRNRIYAEVFSLAWVQTNMPAAEVRRQRKAGRRGMIFGFTVAVLLLLAYLVFHPMVTRYQEAKIARDAVARLNQAYRYVWHYQDTFEDAFEVVVGGTLVPVTGSGSLVYESPDRVNLTLKSQWTSPETEVRLLRDGPQCWIYAPAANEYVALEPPPGPTPFDLPPWLAEHLGPLRTLPLYRLLLTGPSEERVPREVRDIQFGGHAEVDGQPAHIVHWNQEAPPFLNWLPRGGSPPERTPIPIRAWVNASNDLVLRMQMDLSPWAKALVGQPDSVPVTGLAVTESHRFIHRTGAPTLRSRFRGGPPPSGTRGSQSERGEGPGDEFGFRPPPWGGRAEGEPGAEAPRERGRFRPPAQARAVARLQLPTPNLLELASPQRQFSRWIPPRLRQATPELIDLTAYYNAALVQTWHPGAISNSLDVLPCGLLQMGEAVFDVRGIVQLAGRRLASVGAQYPQEITGIKVAQPCRLLHFLHACGWSAPEGTSIGSYVVHYASGAKQVIPIVYGQDVRDWNASGDSSTKVERGLLVWNNTNKAHHPVRLFQTTWVNPRPEIQITTLDYVSDLSDAAPFLLAITAER